MQKATIFVLSFLCLGLLFTTGCGGAKLTPAEKAVAKEFLKGAGPNALAAFLRNEPTIEYSKDDDKKKTAKKIAQAARVLKFVKYFFSQGADVDGAHFEGRTPLFDAIEFEKESKSFPIVKFLISNKADVNAEVVNERYEWDNGDQFRVKTTTTPLDIAEKGGNDAMIKYIKSKGGKSGDRTRTRISQSSDRTMPVQDRGW